MSDPFGNDDQNPFAEVDEYNPFARGGSTQPRVVINESPQSPPQIVASDRTENPFTSQAYYDSTPIRLEDSDSDSDEGPSYFDLQEENPYTYTNQPTSPTSSSRGVVSVQENAASDGSEQSVWELAYYRQFFNVDSSEVGWRCLRSMWPFKVDFINFVATNPDFYGPLWITTTLIFMMAACANFANYLFDMSGWHYDFLKLTVGTGIIYGYAFGIPILFWLYFKWADLNISLIELLCIYGYSFFIYIVVAIVCIAPFNPVQWAAVSVGCLLSTSFLIVNMWAPLRGKLVHAIPIIVVMAALHVGIGLTFMLYFFQFRPDPLTPVTPPSPSPPATFF